MNDRQRLEAIVDVVRSYLPPDCISREEAMSQIIALVDPLPAQPEQEPDAYMTYKGYLYHASDPKVLEHSDPTPLYAAPPSKSWQSLTDEERSDVIGDIFGNIFAAPQKSLSLARAIEAKLKEKNT